ncbi:glycoside hydrolase family 31 protein [Schizothecium vesticola]|uniref:alpha-glucosidase n=1 Tax=Schizothecium vesticola TaxID=314040 RepID=A0AA40FA35_9PEZI|nr:glycoside hydrolase family 31 protein [Schizothecium vesticola]
MSIALLLLVLLSLGLVNSQHGRRNILLPLPSVGLGLFTMVSFTAASYFLFATLAPDCAAEVVTTTGPSSQGTATWMSTSSSPVFTVPASADIGMNVLPNVKDPDAVDPQDVCPGYKATNVETSDSGFTADLRLAGPACSVYGNDVEDLTLLVKFQTADRIHLQIQPRYIGPQNESWFLLPEVLVPSPPDTSFLIADHPLEVSWSNEPSFWFSVTRRDTGDTLFTTEGNILVFEDQFFEFGSPLPENYNLYGLGETIHGFRLGNNLTRTLFNSDVGDVPDANLYGSHPLYLDTRYFSQSPSGSLTYAAHPDDRSAQYGSFTHGVYLRNAHAQEVLLRPSGLTWRAIGGSIDLYVYAGPSATDVIAAYQKSAAGLPAMQQYWTLGYHQCRWGYESWTQLQGVVDSFERFEIPLETIWVDIDYMKRYRDFDNDPVRFGYKEGAEFLDRLHRSGRHFVPIVDSAIYAPNPENPDDAYETYERGVKADAFMLNPDGSLYIGAVWPGYTVFPDWIGAVLNGTGAIDWWIHEFELWYKKIKYDGIWIDMSEVASFCVGSCGSGNLTLNPVHPPFALPGEPGNLVLEYPEGFELTNSSEAASASSALATQTTLTPTSTTAPYHRTTPTPGSRDVNWPPYVLNAHHGDLAVHALSPNATHHGPSLVDYDFHNLYGHQILNATYHAVLTTHPGLRPFLIGRSTSIGSGRLAGHWGGDNAATYAQMAASIPQALSLALAGVPFFGVDACGFAGNTDAQLCARWMQLAAFFPFFRNHNALGAIPQEPYVWASVADATRTAMRVRYALLPYWYTLLARAHRDGDTVLRALAWEFPHEPWLAGVDGQFLVGPAVMVIPVLEPGADTVQGVFPGQGEGQVWYDWYTQTAVAVGAGGNVTLDAPMGHIPVFVRGGHVLPTQGVGMTTKEGRGKPWGVVVALDRGGEASGGLYVDDGKSLVVGEELWVEFLVRDKTLYARMTGNYTDKNPLANVTVMGVGEAPGRVELNGTELDDGLWVWSRERKHLQVMGLEERFGEGAWRWGWRLSWE